jgi:protein O-GlcNAc transferase
MALRAELRERVRRSPLGDPAGFTRALEAAYRTLWRRWCAADRGAAPPS